MPVLSLTGRPDAATLHHVAEDFRASLARAGFAADSEPIITWHSAEDVPAEIDMTMCPGVAATAAIRVQATVSAT